MRISTPALFVAFGLIALAACDAAGPEFDVLDAPIALSEDTLVPDSVASGLQSAHVPLANFSVSPRITSIGGISDGQSTNNGRWTGQPSSAPPSASNRYLNWLALDSYRPADYPWTIRGTGFGTQRGTVLLTLSHYSQSQTRVEVLSWSDTEIRVRPSAPVGFESRRRADIIVRTASGQTVGRSEDIVELIKSRGAGQCTYYVALRRIQAGLEPPLPNAYATKGSISASYVPRRYDALTYNGHVAIITSIPNKTTSGTTTRYTFTVSEMNARYDEAISTSRREFVVRNGAVVQGIGTNASAVGRALGYYR